MVLATNGGLARLFDDMDRQVAGEEGADGLAPVSAPYFAVNVLGNRVAADHGLKAFALTMASPRTAAMDAVEAGARALRAGRCDVALVAATEHRLPGGAAGEEGAVAFLLEAGDQHEAPVLRAGSLFVPPQIRTAPEGTGRAEWLMWYRADKTADFAGYLRLDGGVGGRSGSLAEPSTRQRAYRPEAGNRASAACARARRR